MMTKKIVLAISCLVLIGCVIAFVKVYLSHNHPKRLVSITMCNAALSHIDKALEEYKAKVKRYPINLEHLWETVRTKRIAKDPWQNKWEYRITRDGENCYLRSIGPDGKPGTKDDINSETHPWPKTK